MPNRTCFVAALIGLLSASVNAGQRPIEQFQDALRRFDASPGPQSAADVDAAAGQKDATVSRLFWHTDLNQALAEAKRTGRPVLSLRLLGRLDEDLSCANSRFFRTTLYANQRVSDYLRSHYVLHWQSVRPVPTLTVDYGDSRKIVTTITGNSIHYVLDADGKVVDAIPGLYSPARFLSLLTEAEAASRQSASDRRARLLAIAPLPFTAKAVPPTNTTSTVALRPPAPVPPPAAIAARLAVSKTGVERKAVTVLTARTPKADESAISTSNVVFDESSLRLMHRKMPRDLSQADADRMVANLRQSVARDEAINDGTLRPQILRHVLMTPDEPLATLNDWVYANVFATPGSDPWLGLRSADAFNGVENGGVIDRPGATAAR